MVLAETIDTESQFSDPPELDIFVIHAAGV